MSISTFKIHKHQDWKTIFSPSTTEQQWKSWRRILNVTSFQECIKSICVEKMLNVRDSSKDKPSLRLPEMRQWDHTVMKKDTKAKRVVWFQIWNVSSDSNPELHRSWEPGARGQARTRAVLGGQLSRAKQALETSVLLRMFWVFPRVKSHVLFPKLEVRTLLIRQAFP